MDSVTEKHPVADYQQLINNARLALLPADAHTDNVPVTLLMDLYPGLRNWGSLLRDLGKLLSNPAPDRGHSFPEARELDALTSLMSKQYVTRANVPDVTPMRNALMATVSEDQAPLSEFLQALNHRRQWANRMQAKPHVWEHINRQKYWEDVCNAVALVCMPDVFNDDRLHALITYGENSMGSFYYVYSRTMNALTNTVAVIPRLRTNMHNQVDIF